MDKIFRKAYKNSKNEKICFRLIQTLKREPSL